MAKVAHAFLLPDRDAFSVFTHAREGILITDAQGRIRKGNTIADMRTQPKQAANMKVAMAVDSKRFVDLFMQRLYDLASRSAD